MEGQRVYSMPILPIHLILIFLDGFQYLISVIIDVLHNYSVITMPELVLDVLYYLFLLPDNIVGIEVLYILLTNMECGQP